MMNGRVQRQHTLPGARAGQSALLVRAVVGSLVFCAVLAPHAFGQSSPAQSPDAEQGAKEQKVEKFPSINTKPFTDLLLRAKALKDAGQLDLSGNLEMEAEAERLEDGHLSNVSITSGSASSPELIRLAKDFLIAISDGTLLSPLRGIRHLKMKFTLDHTNISIRVLTEVSSELEASNMASGYSGVIFLGTMSKKGKTEEAIFKSIRIAAEGKQLVFTFNMTRAAAGELLSRLIERHQPAAAPAPSN